MKLLTFIITTVISLGLGAAWFFMLILSLNGFTEKQAEPGLILFVVWAALSAIIAGTLSYLSAGYLSEKRSFTPALAALASTVVFVIVCAASDFIGFLAAVILTTARR
jgi:hypothetical protein